MNPRTEVILEKIVIHYVSTAEPVGSRALTKLVDINISAATVRNIMADLTDMGLIVQPHISAGRIPTDLGYRYYINEILNNVENNSAKTELPDISDHSFNVSRLEDILVEAITELTNATDCTSVVLSPQASVSKLKKIEFIKLNNKQILIILITKIGMVRNKIIQLRESPEQDRLNKISGLLCDLFEGETIKDIREKLVESLSKISDEIDFPISQAIRLGKKTFELDIENDIFVLGRSKMCSFPEFGDQERLKNVYSILDDKTALFKTLINIMNNDGVQIKIGNENKFEGLDQCSIVAGSYGNQNYLLGSIGIIGPTRIDYSKIIPEIDYSTQKLSYAVDKFLSN